MRHTVVAEGSIAGEGSDNLANRVCLDAESLDMRITAPVTHVVSKASQRLPFNCALSELPDSTAGSQRHMCKVP